MFKVVGALSLLLCCMVMAAQIVVDRNCADINQIPPQVLEKVRKEFKIAYGHTSHGSQLISGMEALRDANPVLYNFSTATGNPPAGALSLWDRVPPGDLGNPDRERWAEHTARLLNGPGKDRNVIVWSWCGQVSTADRRDIQNYLKLMSKLEKDFPGVKFVYMTGHLDGSGEKGNLHERNEQIRDFCRKNNKILFDFADIESYSPDGDINYMKLNARDDCSYRHGGRKGNWAEEWITRNSGHGLELPAKAAHTHPLNAALKGRAFWWLLARMSGWTPSAAPGKISPVSRAAAPADAGVEPASGAALIFRFDKIQDYRPWAALGTKESIVPPEGAGVLIPPGTPAGITFRGLVSVKELEFKARLESGTTINWYLNTDWKNNWKPDVGVGGVLSDKGCLLVLNGNTIRCAAPDASANGEYYFQVIIKNDVLYWTINGKLVAEQKIPKETAERKGSLIIGGWKSKVRVNGVFFRTR